MQQELGRDVRGRPAAAARDGEGQATSRVGAHDDVGAGVYDGAIQPGGGVRVGTEPVQEHVAGDGVSLLDPGLRDGVRVGLDAGLGAGLHHQKQGVPFFPLEEVPPVEADVGAGTEAHACWFTP